MSRKRAAKRVARPRLTLDINPALKRRIKVAAAAHDAAVSEYVARLLERALERETATPRSSDGTISAAMTHRAAKLRAAQKAPFDDDSLELIREAREQRDAEL
jgi:hypothetical protein